MVLTIGDNNNSIIGLDTTNIDNLGRLPIVILKLILNFVWDYDKFEKKYNINPWKMNLVFVSKNWYQMISTCIPVYVYHPRSPITYFRNINGLSIAFQSLYEILETKNETIKSQFQRDMISNLKHITIYCRRPALDAIHPSVFQPNHLVSLTLSSNTVCIFFSKHYMDQLNNLKILKLKEIRANIPLLLGNIVKRITQLTVLFLPPMWESYDLLKSNVTDLFNLLYDNEHLEKLKIDLSSNVNIDFYPKLKSLKELAIRGKYSNQKSTYLESFITSPLCTNLTSLTIIELSLSISFIDFLLKPNSTIIENLSIYIYSSSELTITNQILKNLTLVFMYNYTFIEKSFEHSNLDSLSILLHITDYAYIPPWHEKVNSSLIVTSIPKIKYLTLSMEFEPNNVEWKSFTKNLITINTQLIHLTLKFKFLSTSDLKMILEMFLKHPKLKFITLTYVNISVHKTTEFTEFLADNRFHSDHYVKESFAFKFKPSKLIISKRTILRNTQLKGKNKKIN